MGLLNSLVGIIVTSHSDVAILEELAKHFEKPVALIEVGESKVSVLAEDFKLANVALMHIKNSDYAQLDGLLDVVILERREHLVQLFQKTKTILLEPEPTTDHENMLWISLADVVVVQPGNINFETFARFANCVTMDLQREGELAALITSVAAGTTAVAEFQLIIRQGLHLQIQSNQLAAKTNKKFKKELQTTHNELSGAQSMIAERAVAVAAEKKKVKAAAEKLSTVLSDHKVAMALLEERHNVAIALLTSEHNSRTLLFEKKLNDVEAELKQYQIKEDNRLANRVASVFGAGASKKTD